MKAARVGSSTTGMAGSWKCVFNKLRKDSGTSMVTDGGASLTQNFCASAVPGPSMNKMSIGISAEPNVRVE